MGGKMKTYDKIKAVTTEPDDCFQMLCEIVDEMQKEILGLRAITGALNIRTIGLKKIGRKL